MVSIIIPCLNHFDITKHCVNFLYHNTPSLSSGRDELIIIDDGSNDETKIDLQCLLEYKYTIIRHWPTNIGFGPSVNDGIRVAKGDLICISNNDILVGYKWLDMLVEALDSPEVGMVTSKLVGTETVNPENFDEWSKEQSERHLFDPLAVWAKGGPWLFKKEVFDKLGLFDEQFEYGQYEDTDMLLRMAQAKMLWGTRNSSLAFHYGSVTQQGELKRRVGTNYIERNAQKFREKWNTSHITPARIQQVYEGKELPVDGL